MTQISDHPSVESGSNGNGDTDPSANVDSICPEDVIPILTKLVVGVEYLSETMDSMREEQREHRELLKHIKQVIEAKL